MNQGEKAVVYKHVACGIVQINVLIIAQNLVFEYPHLSQKFKPFRLFLEVVGFFESDKIPDRPPDKPIDDGAVLAFSAVVRCSFGSCVTTSTFFSQP